MIKPDSTITVTVPHQVSDRYIEEFIAQKSDWIQKIISHFETLPKAEPKQFCEGEEWLYLGNPLRLKILTGPKKSPIYILNNNLIIPLSPRERAAFSGGTPSGGSAGAREKLFTWYRSMAKDIIEDRVHIYAQKIGKTPNQIRIKSLRSRWGSCSSKGNLNFNWTLIMAPLDVLDYVVIHELCHLVHHNHSQRFWNLVEKHDPDFKSKKKWLKRNQHQMSVFFGPNH